MSSVAPVVFCGHGSPTNAIDAKSQALLPLVPLMRTYETARRFYEANEDE